MTDQERRFSGPDVDVARGCGVTQPVQTSYPAWKPDEFSCPQCGWMGTPDKMLVVEKRNACPSCGQMGRWVRVPRTTGTIRGGGTK